MGGGLPQGLKPTTFNCRYQRPKGLLHSVWDEAMAKCLKAHSTLRFA